MVLYCRRLSSSVHTFFLFRLFLSVFLLNSDLKSKEESHTAVVTMEGSNYLLLVHSNLKLGACN
jgi:hypothetical protein